MKLNGAEMRELSALDQEQVRLNACFGVFLRLLEGRMGLEEGAIGSTHQVNPVTREVEEVEKEES